jgi:hypothetical protein
LKKYGDLQENPSMMKQRTHQIKKKRLLLYYLSFLPPQISAVAFTALNGGSSITSATISTNLDKEPSLLRNGFFNRVSYWQLR